MTNIDLDKLEQQRAKATPGSWSAYNMADDVYDSKDGEGWWWVWRDSSRPYYGGILEMDHNERIKDPKFEGAIGEAQITDNRGGQTERNDAEWIAAIHNAAPQLIAELREARAALSQIEGMAEKAVELQRENDASNGKRMSGAARGFDLIWKTATRALDGGQ